MTTKTQKEVMESGNSRIEREYVVELVTENPGISAIHRHLRTALSAAIKEGNIVGRLRHGVMGHYTPQYVEKYNL